MMISLGFTCLQFFNVIESKVHSKNIWAVKIKIAVVRLVKSLVIFILPSCYL
jgi:hypothetical protein